MYVSVSKGDQICTARGRTYTEGRLGEKNYYHLRLLKGYGSVQEAKHNKQSVMFALNMLNGDFYPTALLEIAEHVELNELISRLDYLYENVKLLRAVYSGEYDVGS